MAYLQMAAFFEDQNLTGMAAWMRAQSEEEREHGHRFFEFVLDRGNQVRIGPMEAPRCRLQLPGNRVRSLAQSGESRDRGDPRSISARY